MRFSCFPAFLLVLSCQTVIGQNCINAGFESTSVGAHSTATAVSGWSISSRTYTSCSSSTVMSPGSNEFSIVATPITSIPQMGILGSSPFGGSNVAKLNDHTASSKITRLTRTITVTSSSNWIAYAFAGIWQDGNHNCCEQAGLKVTFTTCSGTIIPCYTLGLGPGVGCQSANSTYSYSGGYAWTNWQTRYIDLTPYVGSCITMDVESKDCAYGDHFGSVFFDATCTNTLIGWCICNPGPGISPVWSFCPGANVAMLQAPMGYAGYFWEGPTGYSVSPAQATLQTLPVLNPLAGSIYTVNLITSNGCIYKFVDTLQFSQVSVAGLGSNPTCAGGSSGSATVLANGSGSGYNYTWKNSNSVTIGTQSVVTNLSSGVYSIIVTALGVSGCGTAAATVTVGVAPQSVTNLILPYCGNLAFLPNLGGSNHRWYAGTTLITGSLASQPAYTVTSPCNGCVYRHVFDTPQGCRDSIAYTLYQVQPGALSIPANNIKVICPGASNGTAVVTMTPAPGAIPNSNYFSIVSTGTTPAYSWSVSSPFTTQSIAGLSPGTYSANAFDGSCLYTNTFVVPALNWSFQLTPSATLCPGNSFAAVASFTSPPSSTQYSYSWTPTTWLMAGTSTLQTTIVTPSTAPPGGSLSIIYSVVVTPSVANCPLTKTISITTLNPTPPVITPLPPLCKYGSAYTVQGTPAGGIYTGNTAVGYNSGIINPLISVPGVNTFTYSILTHTCVSKVTSSYTILPGPVLSITGNTNICAGQSTTLFASGANTYTWSMGANSSSITLTPAQSLTMSVSGTGTANSCAEITNTSLIVHPLPAISVSGFTNICRGSAANFTASGAQTYTWSTGTVSPSTNFTPAQTATLGVTGTGTAGNCINTKLITMSVVPVPTLNIIGDLLICHGDLMFLVPYGAETFSLNGMAGTTFTAFLTENTPLVLTGSNAGICLSSRFFNVGVQECLEIEKPSGIEEVKIFPNPFENLLTVISHGSSSLKILDAGHKSVFDLELVEGENVIDLSALANGFYTLRIGSDQGIRFYKLLKADRH